MCNDCSQVFFMQMESNDQRFVKRFLMRDGQFFEKYNLATVNFVGVVEHKVVNLPRAFMYF